MLKGSGSEFERLQERLSLYFIFKNEVYGLLVTGTGASIAPTTKCRIRGRSEHHLGRPSSSPQNEELYARPQGSVLLLGRLQRWCFAAALPCAVWLDSPASLPISSALFPLPLLISHFPVVITVGGITVVSKLLSPHPFSSGNPYQSERLKTRLQFAAVPTQNPLAASP